MKPQIRYIRTGYKTILERTVFLFIILNSNFKMFAKKKQFQVPDSWQCRTVRCYLLLYICISVQRPDEFTKTNKTKDLL